MSPQRTQTPSLYHSYIFSVVVKRISKDFWAYLCPYSKKDQRQKISEVRKAGGRKK
jgi:hypothetical protein